MAQGELHDRVHQKMSPTLDALSVFKDGRRANSLCSYLGFADRRVCFVYSTRERSRLHVDVMFALYVPITESVTLIPSSKS